MSRFKTLHVVYFWFTGLCGSVVTPAFSQALLPLSQSIEIHSQVNDLRFPLKRAIAYDSSKQGQVDTYALSDRFIKSYQHSFDKCGEVIAISTTIDGLFEQWKLSVPHRKIIKGKYKSMCARVVKVKKGEHFVYYGVIQFHP